MLKRIVISSLTLSIASTYLLISPWQKVEANNLNFKINNFSLMAQNQPRRLNFKLPNRGIPGARIGGAVRSGEKSVIAVIPADKMALTSSEMPTIFVYIGDENSSMGNLTIKDETGKNVYSSEFKSPQKKGILRIQLPENFTLETDKPYRWEIQLQPSQNNPMLALKYKTSGWLEKVSLEKESRENVETWENLNTLAEAGIWYDTLAKLAVLRLENPEDKTIETEWIELLNSVGLESISDSNIISEIIKM